jgi:EmrB/QacA subfamily drug resistance transporter
VSGGRDEVITEAPGADEVVVVPWPILWRERITGRAAESDRYPWLVLAVALTGLFSVGFTITILSVSIPAIADDLATTDATLTWVITGPLLAYAVVGPAAGKLGDLYGSRRLYLLSLVGVMVFAGLTALAWSAAALIAFRVLGAAVGAAAGPSSLAMINKLFPPERRAQALGYWSLVAAGGPVIGVVAGGPIVEAFGWRWIFIIQVPISAVALLVGFLVLPETERLTNVRFDLGGSVLLGLGVGSLLYGLNRGPVLGWDEPQVVVAFALCPAFLVAFMWWERRIEHPLIPLEYFRRRNFAFPIANQFFANFAYMGGFVITPLLLQDVMGYSQTRTGLLSIARPLTFSIAGPVAGYLATRVGERRNAVLGSVLIVASMLGLATVGPGSTDLVVVAALALSGVGMGTAATAMAASVANAVRDRDLGVATASQQMMAQVGVVSGIQILQTVQQAREPAVGAAASYHWAYLVGGLAGLLAVLFALFVRSTRRAEAVGEVPAAGPMRLRPSSP